MWYLLRHALAVLVLPVTVVLCIPFWIVRRYDVPVTRPSTTRDVALAFAGALALAVGLTLFGASLRRFFSEGRGTLAPWDPPRRLVVRGPYRYVRNPMISGVLFTLFGEALLLRSTLHLNWAVVFLTINAIYIPLLEEPMLRQRFGADYLEYSRHVRRFIPRLRPWQPSGEIRS